MSWEPWMRNDDEQYDRLHDEGRRMPWQVEGARRHGKVYEGKVARALAGLFAAMGRLP